MTLDLIIQWKLKAPALLSIFVKFFNVGYVIWNAIWDGTYIIHSIIKQKKEVLIVFIVFYNHILLVQIWLKFLYKFNEL